MRTVAATPEQIPGLLARMGVARTTKLAGYCGGDPAAAIAANIERSTLTWCGLDDAGVVVMGGVLPMDVAGCGYVWQFLTDAVRQNKRGYVEMSRAMLPRLLGQYERLIAAVETEYGAALRHVRRLGGRLGGLHPINGHQVHYCERTRA